VAQAAVPDIQKINLDNLSKINGLIERATTWLGKTTSVFEQLRTEDIIDIYKGLRDDIMAGRDINLGGIQSGLSVSELATRAVAAGGTNVNNFYITVETDATQSNAMIGKTLDNVIKTYTRTGGGGGGGVLVAL